MQQQQSHSHFNPLHQQLAALLSAAAAATTTATSDAASLDDVSKSNKEDVRVNALESLRRTVLNLHPSSSMLLSQSALFLSHGLSQLLSDQSYAVRRAAAVAYGCLCAVLAPTPIASNGLIDRFIAWALPLLGNIGSRSFSSELALESLQEFLNVGDASNIERYVPSILKACQELLEDERTSFSLLQHLLGFLTFISRKFEHCFQPHFVDIVDVLLGWAFIPELSESDRCIITNSFLQFKKQWLNNLHFSIGLLSKFLGDMEILIHDSSLEFKQQFGRLLALFSCFSTVLYVTACGMVEMNLIEQISDPIDNITPRLLRFVLLFGSKFGWSSWTRDFWRCLTLMAEILKEKFSNFYPMAINALFHSLKGVSSSHVLGLLKTNMQLFSSQKLALLPASVQTLLQFDSPLSQLRLHPNRLVVASTAATYLYLSRHGCDSVVSQVVNFLVEELGMLKGMLANCNRLVQSNSELVSSKYKSETELLSLIRFDLKVLLSCASVGMDKSCSEGSAGNERLTTVSSFILESLNPFEPPVQDFLDLQVHIIRTLQKLSEVEFLTKLAGSQNSSMSVVSIEFLRKYNTCLTRALDGSSPLGVKRAALNWICTCGTIVAGMDKGADFTERFFKPYEDASICSCLLSLILSASYDRELNLRSLVASVLEVLLQARLINPRNFCLVSVVSLDKLSDLDISVKKSFLRVLSIIVPLTIYTRGFVDDRSDFHKFKVATTGTVCYPDWKRVLALKQLPRKFHSQHLVSILGYISQRWKVPLSSWVQRLVFSCRGKRDVSPSLHEVDGDVHNDDVIEGNLLEKICPVSNLAAIWWATHEAARYCITLRLRTNLGGPTQTFAALERMLLDVPNVLLFDTEQSEGKYMGSYNFHLLPMRLLLEFVEALKKHVYNAYEGSCILPSSPRQSSLFFRANKKVCEEWFSRICDPMMNAGLALHCHDATLHYCALRLQDLATRVTPENVHNLRSRLESDVFMVLRHASLALCRTHDSSALIGLQKWASMTFPFLFADEKPLDTRNLSWMTGLAYQAQGQYEKAAAHFSHLLQSEDTLTSMGSEGIQFVIARVIESYTSLSDWKSFDIWLTELQSLRAAHAGKTYSGALTAAGNEINAIHALARFDEGDIHGSWGYLDLTPKSSNELTLDPKLALERSEQMLLRSMLQRDGSGDLEKARLMLEESLSLVPLDGLNEVSACAVQFHCINAFEEGLKYEGLDEPIQMLGSLCHVLKSPIRRVHQDCSLWIKVLRVYRTVMPTSLMTSLLGEKLLCLARKQNNFILADRMKEFLIEQLQSCAGDMLKELLLLNLEYESILLKYAEGKHEEALIDLWSYIRTTVLSSNTSTPNISTVVKAKACLKFSTWLRRENSNINNLRNVISKIREDFSACDVLDADSNMIAEEIVGLTTKLSCNLCPTMGKTWLSYSSWCFHQAKCSLPLRGSHLLSPVLDQELSQDRFQLSEEEMSKVKSIVAKICHDSSVLLSNGPDMKSEAVMNSLVHQTIYLMQAAAGGPGIESSNGECLSDSLSSQLSVLFLSIDANIKKNDIVSFIDELVDVWWLLRQRRVALFGHAAYGYFQYLAQSSSKLHENPYSSLHPDVVKNNSTNSTLRAMLYILHILLNYGVELKETLEHGFASVPLLPWQDITPQLFARLSSHPKEIVRKQLEGVLMMLAKLSPRSIVYPLLVDINAYEGEPSDELQQILDCLVKLYPKLIEDVQLVIHGLGSITVLWEEQWLNTLQDLHSDVIRRINMLKEEAARITENSTLSHTEKNKINAAKYSAMMAPIIVALDRRLVSTSREPQTAHEAWFQMEYGVQLKSAISAFKTPPTSASSLSDVWRPFDAIAASLVTHQRKSCINLTEVAPQLASLSSSEVPIPGSLSSGIITISSFCEQVTILSTKTKPKKLALFGSDGQKYTYLLKGREDLRLDARIMQLLEALNSSFSSCGNTLSQSLSIRYYSVTPISGRAGLIQWVDNVTSMYSIYKSWQVRVQLAQLAVAGAGNSNSSVPPVPRPSDMFYGKIIPALKEKGIRRVISRRDWPHEVKRKVLLELMKDTPKQLLWQEMWCASEGFRGFSSMSKRFSNSVAAMSIVGHILGLGDRHLDNILMDFCNGDIIHIDYNVCFDKGKRLKIPEIVPFRLTQTIETALGLTGIEGAFRTSCEAVKDILCKNKDVILMLLEVFVWDPLVEWTRGDNHDEAVIGGEEKKGMELAVSLSLFASRFQEIRIPLQEHHDLLVSTLPASESSLSRFLNALNQYEVISAVFYHVDKERSSLLQHETSAKSIVAEATSLSEKSRASFEVHAHEFGQAKTMAIEKAQEAALWVDQHGMVLDALRSGSIPEAQLSGMEEALSLTSAVLVSGVPLTIVPEPTQAQCSEIDREVRNLILELDNGLSGAIESLTEYAFALQRVLPLNYITTSPVNSWAQILQMSVNNLSADVLSLVERQAADLIAKDQRNLPDSVQQRHFDLLFRLERCVKHMRTVEVECSEMRRSIGPDVESKSKDLLLSTFTKYMQSAGYASKGDSKMLENTDLKKTQVMFVLRLAVNELYKDFKEKVLNISNTPSERVDWMAGDVGLQPDYGKIFREFEEQTEKCVLVSGIVNEVQELVGLDVDSSKVSTTDEKHESQGTWASVFKASLDSCKQLVEQMSEVVLPEIIRSVVSYNSEAMEAFGSLSQIRGSIDMALEKLFEVEMERETLVELEKTYFVQVGLITEQQLALEEASLKGRDHLSWEEAEEIATQEDACKSQLDRLHQSWNEKDLRTSSLTKIESNIRNSLVSSEQYFSSLLNTENLLSALVKPFSDLELIDQMLTSYVSLPSYFNWSSMSPSDIVSSGSPLSELMWGSAKLLKNHSFFIWKISILDFVLDSCLRDISSSMDNNFGFDQLYNALKNKIEIHLHEYVSHYLKRRVAPALVAQIDIEDQKMQQIVSDQFKMDAGVTRRVQLMLEEYCTAHETARAARSAIFIMERQVTELAEALKKTILEIIQMEWLHDTSLPHLLETEVLPQSIIENNILSPLVLNLSRPKLLEKIQSSMSTIGRSLEYLQACERSSVIAEGQLERAMGWACGSPNTVGQGNSSVKSSGIPSEFHDHLLKRKQFLHEIREQASAIIKICTSVMEFEASRDGLFRIPCEKSSGRPVDDGRSWQQAYLSALTRLDAAYHSFIRSEQEWKVAQSNLEAASSRLFSASNQLHITSVKAKSSSGDLQETLAAMRDCAYEASLALSSFSRVSKGHTALTSECGSMLEEVLAISEGLPDVYSLGKEAAAAHSALMENLSKANKILLPLEASLSSDLTAISVAMPKERESNVDVPPLHGQALYKSYCLRLQEACQSLIPLVPSIVNSVKELHSMLIKLARSSSMHAGNLHKALEGLGESQVVSSEDLALARTEILDSTVEFENKERGSLGSSGGSTEENSAADVLSLQDDEWISPPQYSFTSSLNSSISSDNASLNETSDRTDKLQNNIDSENGDKVVSLTDTDGLENAYVVKEVFTDSSSASVSFDPSGSMQALHIDQSANLEKGKANDLSSLKMLKGHNHNLENEPLLLDSTRRNIKGKNAYALSVLRQVELKLDGKEIENGRSMEIAEQVDYLLKQATSVDNLCNMYEGWTPWI